MASSAQPVPKFAYVGSYTTKERNARGEGINVYRIDPTTGTSDSWKIITEDALNAVNQTEPGIFDVRSGSDKTSSEGTPYSEW